jgi:hypothetical protein
VKVEGKFHDSYILSIESEMVLILDTCF